MQESAIDTLHEVTEAYLTYVFSQSQIAAICDGRLDITAEDISKGVSAFGRILLERERDE